MRLDVPAELVEAARTGEERSIERLLGAVWPHAYRIARSIVQEDALAEDATQEACAIIYRELATLRSRNAFHAWLYRIVTREALRTAKRRLAALNASDEANTATNSDVEMRIDMLRALASLSPQLRAVIVLHYYAGLSSGEIGGVLSVPGATVRFRLMRARQQLKHSLSPDGNLLAAEASR